MYYEELSIRDAALVANTMHSEMDNVQQAYTLLDDLYDRFFAWVDGPRIEDHEAAVETMLRNVRDLLFETLRDYSIVTGEEIGFDGPIDATIEGGKRAERIRELHALHAAECDRKKLSPEERDRWTQIERMSPAEAIRAIHGLTDKKEANG